MKTKSPQLLFITGTDTDVGKTYVACGVARCLKQRQEPFGVMKPFASGVEKRGAALQSADSDALKAAAGVTDADDLITPVKYLAPLAPNWAARVEERPVDLARARAALKLLLEKYPRAVLEGIGGLMCPLTDDVTLLDFIAPFHPRALIVSHLTLGTLNHTLLTVEALRRRNVEMLGVVCNATRPSTNVMAEQTNPENLRGLLKGIRVFDPIPYRPVGRQADGVFASITDAWLAAHPVR